MTTATYSHYYSLGTNDPRAMTEYPFISANVASTTLTDDEDGTPDGMVALNGIMSWSASTNVTLIGVTDAGYPVLEDTGYYYIVTDRGDLHNTPLTIDSTGYTMCFAAGTMIGTAGSDSPVEELQIGDLVRTQSGQTVPVKWVGRQRLHKIMHRERAQMVRIKAGALGGDLPRRDLEVTGDHGMVLDGFVINASVLINGDSIDWVPMADLPTSFTIYHVETENHDVILANGAASETFVDVATRKSFDNYQDYLDLYGVERIVPELDLPRIASSRLLPGVVRQRLGLAPAPQRCA